jgi:hypothetical protein
MNWPMRQPIGAPDCESTSSKRAASQNQNISKGDVGMGILRASLGRSRQQRRQGRFMTTGLNRAGWTTAAILAGRLIFALVFIMAVSFKLMGHVHRSPRRFLEI